MEMSLGGLGKLGVDVSVTAFPRQHEALGPGFGPDRIHVHIRTVGPPSKTLLHVHTLT